MSGCNCAHVIPWIVIVGYFGTGLILSQVMYILGKFKIGPFALRVRDFEEGLILTIGWPIMILISLVSPLLDLTSRIFNKYVSWLDNKIENYKQKQIAKTKISPSIVERFKV
jgi:hypothetical protein